MAPYFVWKGTDCRDKKIVLVSTPPRIRGEERASHVTIPGRAGDLTLIEGESIYNSYIQTLTIGVKDVQNYEASGRGYIQVKSIIQWLSGEGYLTISTQPNRKQKARVIGAVTLSKVSSGMQWYSGEVQFYCDPLKEALTESAVVMTSNGTITNIGDVIAHPVIKVTAPQSSTSVKVGITGGKEIIVSLGVEKSIIIDCDAQIVTGAESGDNLTSSATGDFPDLPVGDSQLYFAGATSLSIERRCRYL